MYVPNQLLSPRLKCNVGVFWAMQKYAGILKFLLWVLIRISHASWRSSNYAGFYRSVNTEILFKSKYFLAYTKYYFRKPVMCSQKTKSYLPNHPLANLLLKVLVLISKLQHTTKARCSGAHLHPRQFWGWYNRRLLWVWGMHPDWAPGRPQPTTQTNIKS